MARKKGRYPNNLKHPFGKIKTRRFIRTNFKPESAVRLKISAKNLKARVARFFTD